MKILNAFNFIFILLFFLNIQSANQINNSFGQSGTGIIIQSINDSAISHAIGIDSSSRLVISGVTNIADQDYFFVARYLSTGILDTSFGTSGVTSTAIGDFAISTTLALDSTGKIILGGYTIDGGITKFALTKYSSNGTLDTTFGSSGIVKTEIESGAMINSIVIDSSDNIIAGGTAIAEGKALFVLAKYNSLGNLVSTFGNNGITKTSINGNLHNIINSLKIDSNGKFVAGGWTTTTTGTNAAVLRFNQDGSLDTTFNTTGIVSISSSETNHIFGKSIALKSDNSIFIAGGNRNNKSIISKLTSAGTLDTNFGDNGQVVTTFGNNTQINDIALDSNNNLVIAGFHDNNVIVARYNSLGSLDSTFGTNGIEETSVSDSTLAAFALAIQSNNNIVVTGSSNNDVLLAQYTNNSSVSVTISSPANNSTLSYNKFLVTGSSSEASESVSVYIDDVLLETVTTNSLGNWATTQLNSSLNDGTHFIKAELFDNVSSTTATDINKVTIAANNGIINLLTSNMNKGSTFNPDITFVDAGSSITLLAWRILPSTLIQEPIAVLFPIPEDFASNPGYLTLNFYFLVNSTVATGDKANIRIRANFKSSTENFAIPTFDLTTTTGDFTITQPTGSNLKVIQASVTLNPGTIAANDYAYFVFDRAATTGTEFNQNIFLSGLIINYSRDI